MANQLLASFPQPLPQGPPLPGTAQMSSQPCCAHSHPSVPHSQPPPTQSVPHSTPPSVHTHPSASAPFSPATHSCARASALPSTSAPPRVPGPAQTVPGTARGGLRQQQQQPQKKPESASDGCSPSGSDWGDLQGEEEAELLAQVEAAKVQRFGQFLAILRVL